MRIIAAHPKQISSVAFSRDGLRLAIGGAGGVAKILDVVSGEITFREILPGMFPNKVSVQFSADGGLLFATNGHVHFLKLDQSERRTVGPAAYFQLALNPRGTEIWAAGDEAVGRWETKGGKSLAVPRPHKPANVGMLTWPGVAVSACGSCVAMSRKAWMKVGGNRDAVFVYKIKTSVVRFTGEWTGHEAKRLSFHPGGSLLAATCGPTLRVWNLDTQAEVAALHVGKLHFQNAAFSPCGRYLAAVSKDRTARFWDAATFGEVKTFDWDIGKLLDLAFSPDGTMAAVASDAGKVLLFDVD